MASLHHDPETLLAQDGFLRRLALSLVRDAAHADDLVQDAWLAALRRRGGPERLRAWLAGAVRNLAAKVRRGEVRRAEREERAARAEALPSAEEILLRESARQSVVRAVVELDEPYRTTLILRYLDDLPPRRVAQMLGVPVATVHTRIKRALEQLRARLDREHGERSNWAVVLVPMGAVAMTSKTKVACGAAMLVLGAVAFGAAQMLGVGDRGGAGEPVGGVVAAAASQPASEAVRADAPASRIAVDSAPASRPGTDLCTLRVRVVWGEDHTPAEGLHVRLVQWEDPEDYRVRRVHEVVTPADGIFVLRELRPWTSCLYEDRGGSQRVKLRPGEETTAELKIPAGAMVRGTVVTVDGAPVGCAVVEMTGYDAVRVVATTVGDGSFTVRSIYHLVSFGASAPGYAASLRQSVHGRPGETLRPQLVLAPECQLAGVVLDHEDKPLPGASVLVGSEGQTVAPSPPHVHLLGPPGHRVTTDAQGRFHVRGLRPHGVALAAVAPGHAPWFGSSNTVTGRCTEVTLRLGRGETLRGRVTDRAGRPIAGARVGVRQENPHNDFAKMSAAVGADGRFELQHVTRRGFLVWARSADGAYESQSLGELPDGELRWDAVLEPGPELRGSVVDERGEPLAGWRVWATMAGGDVALSAQGGDYTREDGSFLMRNCQDVPATVRVFEDRGLKFRNTIPAATVTGVRPGRGELRIQVPASARFVPAHIRGRIMRSGRSEPGQASIVVWRRGESMSESVGSHRATGRFEALVPPGDYRIHASCTDRPAFQSEERHLAAGETWDLGDIALPEPGTLRVTLPDGDHRELDVRGLGVRAPGDRYDTQLLPDGTGARSGPLAAGEYRLHVIGCGIGFATHPFTIRSGEETRLVLVREPGVEVRPRFVEPIAMPGDPGKLSLHDAAGALVYTFESWPVGRDEPLRIWLAPGSYRVDLTRGAQRCAGELTVGRGASSAGEVTDVQLR